MDNLELIKENVQPLKSGRKIDSLTAALNADPNETKKREETKLEYEEKLQNSLDEEQLEIYYNYINWIEQNYPQGGKDANLKGIFEKCIQKFYNQSKFKNNEKLLSIFLKYTNILDNPLDLFSFFYKSGFSKLLSQYYISWSYHYEAQNNFQKAIKVIEAGIHNNAQPISELNKTLSDLQVRTMRHVIKNPDESEQSTNRKALNKLKVKVDRHGKADAPIKRIGNSVVNNTTGLKITSDKTAKGEQLNIHCDENEEPTSSTIPSNKLPVNNKENERNPGKWPENKLKSKSLRDKQVCDFEIHEDASEKTDQQVEKAKLTTAKIKRDLEFPVARFEDKDLLKKYIWFNIMEEMYRDDTEYSVEEIRYKKWLENEIKRGSNEAKQESIKEESCSISKSLYDSTINETMNKGTTTMVRDFYNGTLATSMCNDQFQVNNKSNIKVKNENVPISQEKFEIYSETTNYLTCKEENNLNFENEDKGHQQIETKHVEFTISNDMTVLKNEDFKSCSSSTPYVNKAFKQPTNTMKLYNHPNFVSGITSKLSPIIETSREFNSKSSSSSSGTMSSTAGHTTRRLFNFPDTINPFEKNLKTHLLQALSDPVEFRKGFCQIKSSLPSIDLDGNCFAVDSNYYLPIKKISDAFIAKNFVVVLYENGYENDFDKCQIFTAKISTNINFWDFYIRDELNRRFVKIFDSPNISLSLMPSKNIVFYNNGILSLHEEVPYGTLRFVIDYYQKMNEPFPEILLKYFILELILVIQKLHQCNIIQADINIDNILMFKIIDDINLIGRKTQTLRFIDFSKAIDMALLPEGTVFNKNYTENDVFSILSMKSWTYWIDWISFLNCVHLMCFNTNMKVNFEDSRWKIEKLFQQPEQQYLNDLFDTLLNLEQNQMPNLNSFINEIQSYLKANHYYLIDEYNLMILDSVLLHI